MSNEQTPTTEPLPPIPAHAVPDPANPGSMIVSASIAPIKAADLRNIGPLMKSGEHDHGLGGSSIASATVAPIPANKVRIPQPPGVSLPPTGHGTARAAAVQLITPVFDVPPVTRIVDVNFLRVASCTLDRAQIVAGDVIGNKGQPDTDAGRAEWQKIRNMAKAYASDTRDEAQLAEAQKTAREVVALMEQLPLTPMSADAMVLAFATISRGNEARENGHPTP